MYWCSGGSFTHDIINYLSKYRIAQKLKSFYYNKYNGLSRHDPLNADTRRGSICFPAQTL